MSDPRANAGVIRLAGLAAGALVIIAASSLLGPTTITPGDVFDAGFSSPFWLYRAPRTALAGCAGAGLAVGGVIFQALFRNPLATPYTLGIASGASLGAACAFLLGLGGLWCNLPKAGLFALGGAVLAMTVVMLAARARAGRDMTRLLLAGVCVAYLCAAGILLVTYLAQQAVTNAIVIWMMGSLALFDAWAWARILVVLLPTLGFAVYSHRALDLLMLGDHVAASRGVAVVFVMRCSFILVGLLTAVIVAHCGPIGFVGLMVPHMVRALVGERALPLVLGSVFVGGAFLAVCDGIARGVATYEVPVGIITNILGAAFFFFLLFTRDVSPAGAR